MSKKILLVDDDNDDAELFLEVIQEIDPTITCYCAGDGRDALEKLNKLNTPDLIFLDINMPFMDGWECLSKIKSDETLRHIPVVMYSTSSHDRDIQKAFNLGAVCFFIKPYEYKELKSALAAIVDNLHGEAVKNIPGLKTSALLCPDTDLSHPQA